MPMREDCKHYQSRTYPSGEVARFCRLDLAPEAPWHCPDDCSMYEKRLVDAGFERGSLTESVPEDEPLQVGQSGSDIAQLLDAAEDIVNDVVPEALEEAAIQNEAAAKEAAGKGLFFKKISAKVRGGKKTS